MRSLLMICIYLGFSFLQAQEFSAKVISVMDGNTFEIIDPEKEKVKIMLSMVDAPELGQSFSEEAKAYAEKLLLKKKVTVEYQGKDFFGNKLAHITLKNGDEVHKLLLEQGLAMVMERKKDTELLAIQEKVKKEQIGLWASDDIVTPWVFRRKQTMLQAKSR
ncbi:thermonuclease family protein [Fulvivirga sp. M361]|uniref:thermonuclease family protein n=1 Tax=Fulvivirga sp. M361 TaxID=2594266 RepID=UPI00162704B9|nr:thermonuclease family protein [Fulvivirga sp. M361]